MESMSMVRTFPIGDLQKRYWIYIYSEPNPPRGVTFKYLFG